MKRAGTVCSVPGCPQLRPCARHHQPARSHRHRKASANVVLTATHCAICGTKFTVDDPPTRGHVKARSLGGTDTPSNYQAECESCNKGQRDR